MYSRGLITPKESQFVGLDRVAVMLIQSSPCGMDHASSMLPLSGQLNCEHAQRKKEARSALISAILSIDEHRAISRMLSLGSRKTEEDGSQSVKYRQQDFLSEKI